jgi:hypothetical protein
LALSQRHFGHEQGEHAPGGTSTLHAHSRIDDRLALVVAVLRDSFMHLVLLRALAAVNALFFQP